MTGRLTDRAANNGDADVSKEWAVSDEAARKEHLITLTADIVAAHVANNAVDISEMTRLIGSVFDALANIGQPKPVEEPAPVPAVSVRASIKRDHLVCLEDGKKLKMLKRYLANRYGMTPDDYRAKWNLPEDYPMVAPAYAEQRRELAKAIGLGRQPGSGRRKRKKLSLAL